MPIHSAPCAGAGTDRPDAGSQPTLCQMPVIAAVPTYQSPDGSWAMIASRSVQPNTSIRPRIKLATRSDPAMSGGVDTLRQRRDRRRLFRGSYGRRERPFDRAPCDGPTVCLRKLASALSNRKCNRVATSGQDARRFVDANT